MLDKKDKTLLEYLFLDARLSSKKLAELTGMKQPSVFKRLKKLQQLNYISGFDSLLNPNLLPYKKYIYFIKGGSDSISKIKKQKPCFSIYPVFHTYNYMIWCYFNSEKERREFEKILPKDKYRINFEKAVATGGSMFDKKTNLKESEKKFEPYKLSKEDILVLKAMGEGGARDTLQQIEAKTGLSIDVIRYRKKKLDKHGYFLRHIIQPGNAFSSFKLIYTVYETSEFIEPNIFNSNPRIITALSGKSQLVLSHIAWSLDDFLINIEPILEKIRSKIKRQYTFVVDKAILLNRYPF